MTSVQISVRKDVYEKLKRAKRPEESFSDAIERILGNESNIPAFLGLYGIAKNPGQDEFLDAFRGGKRQVRESLNKRFGSKAPESGQE